MKRCPSKVYLRSDTVFLQHVKAKGEKNVNDKEKKIFLERQRNISRQRDMLLQELLRQSLIPLRCVLRQLGRENVELHGVSNYLGPFFNIMNNDRYIRQLNIFHSVLDRNRCLQLSRLLSTNKHITTLVLHKCNMHGRILAEFVKEGQFDHMDTMILSGNDINGNDSVSLCLLLRKCKNVKTFSLKSNHLETAGCGELGNEISVHKELRRLDLSWNHLRRNGAIDIAKGIMDNASLTSVSLAWNGFAFEGCSALSEALQYNQVLKELDLTCNRIHPPSFLQLLKGLCRNSSLRKLDLSENPITPAFTSIFLQELFSNGVSGLHELYLNKIVVDQTFETIVQNIKQERKFHVTYERSLPLHIRQERLEMEIQAPSAFNMDPLKLLYLLKEKNRTQDFFNKINKDNDDVVTNEELQTLFKEMGITVTKSVVEKIVEFMDTDKSGTIDLSEFLEGDRKIRKMSRESVRSANKQGQQDYNKHSRSFTRGHIDPMTFQLKIQEPKRLLPPIRSRESSISPVSQK